MNKIPTLSGIDAASAAQTAQQTAQDARLKQLSTQKVSSEKEVDKAAGGFEALLLHQMMESMWSTVEFAGMFNETSNESSVYRDMLSQALADTTSQGRGIGVKDFLRKELLKNSDASKGGGGDTE